MKAERSPATASRPPALATAASSRTIISLVVAVLHAVLIAGLLLFVNREPAQPVLAPLQVTLLSGPKRTTDLPRPPRIAPPPAVDLTRAVELAPPPLRIADGTAAPSATKPLPAAATTVAASMPVIAPVFDAAYLNNPAPSYPALARRLREQGTVVLRVLVSADGSAQQVELQRSSGWPRLDRIARQTVRQWRFVPARQGPLAVAAWVLIPIEFSLNA